VGAVHHHLIRAGLRSRCSLVVESGEPREIMHIALLVGYGAHAVNPWLALDTVRDCARRGDLGELSPEDAVERYIRALHKGILKTISKMGISTLQSYHGGQVFEAVGLHQDVIDRFFSGTPSRIGGIRGDVIAEESRRRHAKAYPERSGAKPMLDWGGEYSFRAQGERHLWTPLAVAELQRAVREDDATAYDRFASEINDRAERAMTIRGLLGFRKGVESIPLEEVEPVEAIVRRFKTGAMSLGSISSEAHETLAIAMNRLGGRSNTGEGGEDERRFVADANGDLRRSAIKQVASGRFGVTAAYLANADEIQIKMAQGAKPGEGGQLPGHKVSAEIAAVRYSTPGVGLISPPPHHDIYSIEDLAQLIFDLKNANPRARVNVKLVAEIGVGTIATVGQPKNVIWVSGNESPMPMHVIEFSA
jgi:glutamate synthase (NADPH) large chain